MYKHVTIDIETDGLKMHDAINFVGVCIDDLISKEYYFFAMPHQLKECRTLLEKLKASKDTRFCFHNGKFDATRLLFHYGIDLPIHNDTMILAYLMSTVDELKDHKNHWLGLKDCAQRLLDVEDWDIKTDKKTSKDPEAVIPYLKKDLEYTAELLRYFIKNLPESKKKIYSLIMRATEAYKYIELNGLPIDLDKLEEVYCNNLKKLNNIEIELNSYDTINFNSSIQLKGLLYEKLKLPVTILTKTGVPSTGVEALTNIRDTHPIVEILLEYRELQKIITFLKDWKARAVIGPLGQTVLYGTFNLHRTVTGRTSCKEPNLQQIPRNKELKSLFRNLIPGWQFVQMDFSQMELRMASIVANVKAMKDSYRNGEDLHTKMAMLVSGKKKEDITKEDRTGAKAANFGYLYGMSAKSFVEYAFQTYGVSTTLEKAQEIRDHFFASYPELLPHYTQTTHELLNYGSVTGVSGREYQISPKIIYADKITRGNYVRGAINATVQTPASDYALCGLIELIKTFPPSEVRICATVHDSVIMLVKEDEHFIERLKKIQHILQSPQLFNKYFSGLTIDIPIVSDIEIGPWGKGVGIEEYSATLGKE